MKMYMLNRHDVVRFLVAGLLASLGWRGTALAQQVQDPSTITAPSDPEWVPAPGAFAGQFQGPGLAPGIDDHGHLLLPVSAGAPIRAVYAEMLHGTNVGLGDGVALLDEVMLRPVGTDSWELVAGSASATGKGLPMASCTKKSPAPAAPTGASGTYLCDGGGYYVTTSDCTATAWGHGSVLTFLRADLPLDRTTGRSPLEAVQAHYYMSEVMDQQTELVTYYDWDPERWRLETISDLDGPIAQLVWQGEGRNRELSSVADRYGTTWQFAQQNQYLRTITTPAGEVYFGYDAYGLLSRTYTTKNGTGFPVGTQIWERRGPFDTSSHPDWKLTHYACQRDNDGYRRLIPAGGECAAGEAKTSAKSQFWPVVVAYSPPVGTPTILTWLNHVPGFGPNGHRYNGMVVVTDTMSKTWVRRVPLLKFETSDGSRGFITMTTSFGSGDMNTVVTSYDPEGNIISNVQMNDLRANRTVPDNRFRQNLYDSHAAAAGGRLRQRQSLEWMDSDTYQIRVADSTAYLEVDVDAHGNPTFRTMKSGGGTLWTETIDWDRGVPARTTYVQGPETTVTTVSTYPGRPDRIYQVATPDGTTTYQYDSHGKVTNITGPGGTTVLEYNARGGLQKVTVNGIVESEVTEWHATPAHPYLTAKRVTFPGGNVLRGMDGSQFFNSQTTTVGQAQFSMAAILDDAGRMVNAQLSLNGATEELAQTFTYSILTGGAGSVPPLPTPTAESADCATEEAQDTSQRAVRLQERSWAFCKDAHTMINCNPEVADSGQVYYDALEIENATKTCVEDPGVAPGPVICQPGTALLVSSSKPRWEGGGSPPPDTCNVAIRVYSERPYGPGGVEAIVPNVAFTIAGSPDISLNTIAEWHCPPGGTCYERGTVQYAVLERGATYSWASAAGELGKAGNFPHVWHKYPAGTGTFTVDNPAGGASCQPIIIRIPEWGFCSAATDANCSWQG